ncbi:efflux RND transporter periplasmic adaptor subunit [Gallionella capsiferriformans]|jgi:Cu(I)/Ag(I) efflux system membrane fusion protein|uniref:Efflux transporter, RND family, MFP subunit n=1 Tax=Gallionella capsiferriformans (strain ES-2) TaxID=395494 RepID=D9SDB2_GALCS|nr:efflux RND transporter periplasmic adaptor subunit [Gallionella capsiferriformans]ADL54742.1 efflux transporter, RND family, MFP subunit [Gallionella capsiferriformans ES-2]ADL56710.1 efflux transporter, RND family, MFP subunit [Gallionella capsiferriformans ES-2]
MKKIIVLVSIIVVVSIISAGSYSLGKRFSGVTAPVTADAVKEERKILYYRNPMGLPDTSPVPKKDAMGMDYVPVYDGDAVQEEGGVNISVEKVQKLGVKSEAATLRGLNKTIHATGRIEIDERRTYTIAPKFEGWVEHLYVNSTGETVNRGQALFDVYSPELVSAQREYAIAAQGEAKLENADEETKAGMKQLADASLARLKNWDITPGEIKQLTTGKSRRSLTYYAPVSGIVLEKKAVQGMRFMPGETLYQIADLSQVWVLADINEQDIGQVTTGSDAQVSIGAYPDKLFKGKVAFVYPTLNSATRTVQVRVEIANPQGLLKPSMFANVTLPVGSNTRMLTVPTSAVIDSGMRQVVLVQLAQGRFAPRTVKLGSRSNDYVEILDGLVEGEQVVTSALFLIDAESNLKAALGGLGGHAAHGGATPVAEDHSAHATPAAPKKNPATIGHQAAGILNGINEDGSVSITHEPIKSLGWPGMTMDFALTNSSLAAGIKPGSKITFELVERKPDEWVITKLQALAPQQHEGH